MRRTLLAGVSTLALVVVGSQAAAADLPAQPVYTKAPPAAPTWTGFYLGVEAGGAFGRSNQIGDIPGTFFGSTTRDGYNVGGALVGGAVGYNLQSGPWVYGLEGDISWSNVQGEVNNFPPFATTTIVATGSRRTSISIPMTPGVIPIV